MASVICGILLLMADVFELSADVLSHIVNLKANNFETMKMIQK
jgi:hypothetical protein